MLIKELPALAGDATTIIWVGGDRGADALRALLPVPEALRRLPYDPDETHAFDVRTLLVAFVGPDPEAHVAPEELAAAVRRLPPGGRMVALLGWPVEELPYHVLLGPLVDAGCQVLQAVPLDKAIRHGAYCAVVAARVSHLAPLRTYLDDSPITLTGDEPDLRTLLRLAGEYTFGDLVSRPLRRRVAELRDKTAAQQQRIRHLEKEAQAREAKLAAAQQRLAAARDGMARLRSSTTFQVGDTMVQGARRPGRAIVSVPVGLVRVWRNRGTERNGRNGRPAAG
jgi:hypothetical protein